MTDITAEHDPADWVEGRCERCNRPVLRQDGQVTRHQDANAPCSINWEYPHEKNLEADECRPDRPAVPGMVGVFAMYRALSGLAAFHGVISPSKPAVYSLHAVARHLLRMPDREVEYSEFEGLTMYASELGEPLRAAVPEVLTDEESKRREGIFNAFRVDPDMPLGRIDYVRVNEHGQVERRVAAVNVGVSSETTTRPLSVGEWPWDKEGKAR